MKLKKNMKKKEREGIDIFFEDVRKKTVELIVIFYIRVP